VGDAGRGASVPSTRAVGYPRNQEGHHFRLVTVGGPQACVRIRSMTEAPGMRATAWPATRVTSSLPSAMLVPSSMSAPGPAPANRVTARLSPSSHRPPPARSPPALPTAADAVAAHLPFPDLSFDAAMAISSVHQWADLPAGIGELVRTDRAPHQ